MPFSEEPEAGRDPQPVVRHQARFHMRPRASHHDVLELLARGGHTVCIGDGGHAAFACMMLGVRRDPAGSLTFYFY